MNKRVILLICLVIFIFSIAGCGDVQKPSTSNKAKVIVNIAGLQGPTSIGMIKMIDEKPSLGTNVASNYQVVKTPDVLLSKILSKEIDIATVPTNLAAIIYNKGVDYKIAAMNTWGVLYLIGSEENINQWKDLKGKTIYSVGKGTTPDIAARYILEKNGLNFEKDLTIDYTMAHVELAQAVAAEKVKLAILPEPFVTMAISKNPKVNIVFDIQKEWDKASGSNGAFPQTCLMVKEELVSKNPAIVDKFLSEYKESIEWVNVNKAQAGKLVEKNGIGIKAKIAETAIPRCNIRYEDAQTAKAKVESFFKIIFNYSPKDIGGKIPNEGLYYQK